MEDKCIELTADIVSSYVSNNSLPVDELPTFIRAVFGALSTVGAPSEPEPVHDKATPAQIKRSIKSDGLVSFEDGKTYQVLKRHLRTYGLTIAEYKAKWGLPADYPTTCASYAARRSELAKSVGLGRTGGRKSKTSKAAVKA